MTTTAGLRPLPTTTIDPLDAIANADDFLDEPTYVSNLPEGTLPDPLTTVEIVRLDLQFENMTLESFREDQDTLKRSIAQQVGVEVGDVNLTFVPANQERQIESETGNTKEKCFIYYFFEQAEK